ncbi:uncharacterized protein [Panulirus ornatus]|uniref:uncharacterized protein n=1 Tax=Panulirus ornatus TaxID=150431 RepID=UPI003A89307D
MLKRSSPSGPSTDDYRHLAAFLPTLISFRDNKNSKGDNQEEGQHIPVLTGTSRIGASEGVLPYIPCVISPFDDLTVITTCFRERLAKHDFLRIFFLGDSKIRNLFYEFLHRSDNEYHYMVKLPNGTLPFAELRRSPAKVHFDMVAMTRAAPRLLVTFRFKKFSETVPSKFKKSSELRQLRKWAEGDETPPHLLVIGYTPWMMQGMQNHYPHDLLADLMEVHRLVVPLLQQVSQKTRVLVLPQSRYRKHAYSGLRAAMMIADSDAVNDWSEMMFLHYLQLNAYKSRPPEARTAASAVPVTGASPREKAAAPGNGRRAGQPSRRDRLVPVGGSPGPWWWDTSLPLNVAAISECEELYRRNLTHHPVYRGRYLQCEDGQHAGQSTLGDLVTMLLNLICNSVLQADPVFCCH